jgi:hypothetical protein
MGSKEPYGSFFSISSQSSFAHLEKTNEGIQVSAVCGYLHQIGFRRPCQPAEVFPVSIGSRGKSFAGGSASSIH